MVNTCKKTVRFLLFVQLRRFAQRFHDLPSSQHNELHMTSSERIPPEMISDDLRWSLLILDSQMAIGCSAPKPGHPVTPQSLVHMFFHVFSMGSTDEFHRVSDYQKRGASDLRAIPAGWMGWAKFMLQHGSTWFNDLLKWLSNILKHVPSNEFWEPFYESVWYMNLFMGTAATQTNRQDQSTTCHPTEHPAWFGPLGIDWMWNNVE